MKSNDCKKCYELSLKRKHIVFGSGDLNAKIMFIGEAPGYYENKTGIPFVGVAGKKLNEFLEMCNFKRNKIYITNIVKCRPPANRAPWDIEIDNCFEYLIEELHKVDPTIIVLLGSTALNAFFKSTRTTKLSILAYAGKLIQIGNKFIIPCYHPSYLLRAESKEELIDKHNKMRDCFKVIVETYIKYADPSHTSKNL